jgi:hypothetical protein
MVDELRQEWTVGEISRRWSEPLHKVEYAIRSRRIRPAARAGIARVFDAEGLAQIEAALREMNARSPYGSRWAEVRATGADRPGGRPMSMPSSDDRLPQPAAVGSATPVIGSGTDGLVGDRGVGHAS